MAEEAGDVSWAVRSLEQLLAVWAQLALLHALLGALLVAVPRVSSDGVVTRGMGKLTQPPSWLLQHTPSTSKATDWFAATNLGEPRQCNAAQPTQGMQVHHPVLAI
jgi:hypothetical protein